MKPEVSLLAADVVGVDSPVFGVDTPEVVALDAAEVVVALAPPVFAADEPPEVTADPVKV